MNEPNPLFCNYQTFYDKVHTTYRVYQQVLDGYPLVKISKPLNQNFGICLAKKIRQIEVKSA